MPPRRKASVTWYTTQIVDQFARPAADGLRKEIRHQGQLCPRRCRGSRACAFSTRRKAGQVHADIFDGTRHAGARSRKGCRSIWCPIRRKRLPTQFRRSATAIGSPPTSMSMTLGFNTDLVPKGTEPKTFRIFSIRNGRARWPGRRAHRRPRRPASSALVLAAMGEEKGTRLSAASSPSRTSRRSARRRAKCSIR